LKFLLGNLYDYNPKKDQIATENLSAVDRYMAYRLAQTLARVNQ